MQEANESVVINFLGLKFQKEIYNLAKEVINKCLEIEKLENKKLQVSVTITNSQEIKQINTTYRNINSETDVLSFPLFEAPELADILKGERNHNIMLGDIIISLDQAKQQANEYGHSIEREIGFLLTHGFYHLLGYDHINPKEEKLMNKKQETALNKLKLHRKTK